MADDADRAAAAAEIYERQIIAQRKAAQSLCPSATHCCECDGPIAEKRRAALAGVQTCIECAEYLERRRR